MFSSSPLAQFSALAFIFLAATLPAATAEPTLCEYVTKKNGKLTVNHPNSLQCRICGPQHGSAPTICVAFNATFDGEPTNKSPPEYYESAQWSNFTVAEPSHTNPILASSHHHYIRTASDGYGHLDFAANSVPSYDHTFWFGDLLSFDYACADPITREAVPCEVAVTSSCVNISASGDQAMSPWTETFDYTPEVEMGAAMATAGWYAASEETSEWQYHGNWCGGYDFQATWANGSEVVLYLDNVLFYHDYNRS